MAPVFWDVMHASVLKEITFANAWDSVWELQFSHSSA
jgi:hypothetical protein